MLHVTFHLKLFRCFHILIFQYKTKTYSLRFIFKRETWQHLNCAFSKSYTCKQKIQLKQNWKFKIICLSQLKNLQATQQIQLTYQRSLVCLSLILPVCHVCLGNTEQGWQENYHSQIVYTPSITDKRYQEEPVLGERHCKTNVVMVLLALW